MGPMHDLVGHAVIPFQMGGAVDMYYFPNGIPGTGFATMELIQPDGKGPKPNRIGTYELVAFTKLNIPDKNNGAGENNPFNIMERRMCGTMTKIASFSFQAVLNPGETCEIPGDKEQPGICLVFDEYDPHGRGFIIGEKKHCLLLCIEIFRKEMEYAIRNGSSSILEKLKAQGHYPYSDLDRAPVV